MEYSKLGMRLMFAIHGELLTINSRTWLDSKVERWNKLNTVHPESIPTSSAIVSEEERESIHILPVLAADSRDNRRLVFVSRNRDTLRLVPASRNCITLGLDPDTYNFDMFRLTKFQQHTRSARIRYFRRKSGKIAEY